MENDPASYGAEDMNLYRLIHNSPTNGTDALELLGWGNQGPPPGPKSKIRICTRNIDVGDDPDLKVQTGAKCCSHVYVDYGTDGNGKPRGLGLFNTNSKKGGTCEDENRLSVLPLPHVGPVIETAGGGWRMETEREGVEMKQPMTRFGIAFVTTDTPMITACYSIIVSLGQRRPQMLAAFRADSLFGL